MYARQQEKHRLQKSTGQKIALVLNNVIKSPYLNIKKSSLKQVNEGNQMHSFFLFFEGKLKSIKINKC